MTGERTSVRGKSEPRQFGRSTLACPFCARQEFPPNELCGGSFLDEDHPSAVRPILIDLDADGEPYPDTEQRMAEARARYAR